METKLYRIPSSQNKLSFAQDNENLIDKVRRKLEKRMHNSVSKSNDKQ